MEDLAEIGSESDSNVANPNVSAFLAYASGQSIGSFVQEFSTQYLARYFDPCYVQSEETLRRPVISGDRRAVNALTTVYEITGEDSDFGSEAKSTIGGGDSEYDSVMRIGDAFLYVAFANERFAQELLTNTQSRARAFFDAAPPERRIVIEIDNSLAPVRAFDDDLLEQVPFVIPVNSREMKAAAEMEKLALRLVLAADDLHIPRYLRGESFDDAVNAIQGVWCPALMDKRKLIRGLQVHANVLKKNIRGQEGAFHRIGLFMMEEKSLWIQELLDSTMHPTNTEMSTSLDLHILYIIYVYTCWEPQRKFTYSLKRMSGMFAGASRASDANVSKKALLELEADDFLCARRVVALALRHRENVYAQEYTAYTLARIARRSANKLFNAFAMPYAIQVTPGMLGTSAQKALFELMQVLSAKKVMTKEQKSRFKRFLASGYMDPDKEKK